MKQWLETNPNLQIQEKKVQYFANHQDNIPNHWPKDRSLYELGCLGSLIHSAPNRGTGSTTTILELVSMWPQVFKRQPSIDLSELLIVLATQPLYFDLIPNPAVPIDDCIAVVPKYDSCLCPPIFDCVQHELTIEQIVLMVKSSRVVQPLLYSENHLQSEYKKLYHDIPRLHRLCKIQDICLSDPRLAVQDGKVVLVDQPNEQPIVTKLWCCDVIHSMLVGNSVPQSIISLHNYFPQRFHRSLPFSPKQLFEMLREYHPSHFTFVLPVVKHNTEFYFDAIMVAPVPGSTPIVPRTIADCTLTTNRFAAILTNQVGRTLKFFDMVQRYQLKYKDIHRLVLSLSFTLSLFHLDDMGWGGWI